MVTSFSHGTAEWLYDSLHCARGQAENLIKLHKSQLPSDRTSCRSALANQVRLVLHTAAYWLMLTVRDAIPKPQPLARAELATFTRTTAQGRRTHHRDGLACAHRLRRCLPRSRSVPQNRPKPATRRTVTAGARAPNSPIPPNAHAALATLKTAYNLRWTCIAVAQGIQKAPTHE